jgi:hypothetical protein
MLCNEKRQSELEKLFSLTTLAQTLVLIGNVLTFLKCVAARHLQSAKFVFLNVYGAQESIPRNEFR